MYQDPEVAQIIRKLDERKREAVQQERYDYAKKLKQAIADLQKVLLQGEVPCAPAGLALDMPVQLWAVPGLQEWVWAQRPRQNRSAADERLDKPVMSPWVPLQMSPQTLGRDTSQTC